MHFFRPRTVMNIIATLRDPAGSALLGLPLLQRRRRIHCRCNCILLELLILTCINVDKSHDITLFILPFQTNKRLRIRRIVAKIKSYIMRRSAAKKKKKKKNMIMINETLQACHTNPFFQYYTLGKNSFTLFAIILRSFRMLL